MKEIIIQGDALAPGGGFLHIGGQREYLELLIPGAVRAGYPSVAFKAAVRHLHIKPLIRLVGPGVPQTQKFADRGVVRAVPGVAPGKTAGCRREAQGVGRTGIHPHPVPTDAHLHRVHGRIAPQVLRGSPCDLLAVAAKKRGAVVQLHRLGVVV